jgi:hypothetical protein
MAVTQTLTITKPGASFATVEDLFAELNAVVDSSYVSYVDTAQSEGTVFNSVSFVENSNTVTLTRIWEDAKYADFQTNWASARETNGQLLEAAGWTISGDAV